MRLSQLAQLVLDASQSNIKLYDWQKKWLDDDRRFRIMLKSRAVGGSFIIALESFLLSLLRPGSVTLLVSYSMRQSLELFRKVKEHINNWRGLRIRAGDDVYSFTATLSETKTQVEFQNGSRIVSLPNNPDAIRGYRADMVYIDEAAMFKNDFAIKSAVIPTIAGREGRLSLISTPKGRRGWFYEAWTSDTFSKHQVHYTEAPHITPQDLEGMRASMNPLEWEQEMEMKFLDELNAVFPYELILQCVEDYETGIRKTENPVYLGIDFGRYRDSTVITCLEKQEDGKLRVFFIHEFLRTDFDTQLDFILRLAGILSPAAIA
ncbi:MAG: terminase family protein, partial [Candidatus Caldarchaeum sp.]